MINKEMIHLPINDFVKANLDFNIASTRKDSEYDFNFTRWKTVIFSSQKLKFVLKYAQSVLQWLSKVVDTTNFFVSIDTTTVDRFNFSIFQNDRHIFNSTLFTNFYLIEEGEWAEKVFEMHASKFDLVEGELSQSDLTTFWRGEEGFEKFINVLYTIIKEPFKYERQYPVQWQVDFKDRKMASSQIRMQLDSLTNTGVRPEDPYLTIEQATLIEKGANPNKVAEAAREESENKGIINPIWDEAIAEEKKFKDINYAMAKTRGIEPPKKRKRR